jgi:hypothetical protein
MTRLSAGQWCHVKQGRPLGSGGSRAERRHRRGYRRWSGAAGRRALTPAHGHHVARDAAQQQPARPVRPCVPTTIRSACRSSATRISSDAGALDDAAAGAQAGSRSRWAASSAPARARASIPRRLAVVSPFSHADIAGARPAYQAERRLGDAGHLDRAAGEDRPARRRVLGCARVAEPSWPSTARVSAAPATSTGHGAWSTTSALTEPSSIEVIAPWPRLPMTIRSARQSAARSTIAVAGRPRTTPLATSRSGPGRERRPRARSPPGGEFLFVAVDERWGGRRPGHAEQRDRLDAVTRITEPAAIRCRPAGRAPRRPGRSRRSPAGRATASAARACSIIGGPSIVYPLHPAVDRLSRSASMASQPPMTVSA